MSESDLEQPKGIPLRIDWHFPAEIQSQYANNVLVQAGQYEIVISFFETQLPILLGQPEENKRMLEELGSIRAECVSKIVVSPEIIPILINALETSLENYRQSKAQE
jgi:uncharacterized protein DUF3467